jgi:hypothetical protein
MSHYHHTYPFVLRICIADSDREITVNESISHYPFFFIISFV